MYPIGYVIECRRPLVESPARRLPRGRDLLWSVSHATLAINNNRWDPQLSDIYHPQFVTAPLQLWPPRESQPVTDTVWLPIGGSLRTNVPR